MLAAYTAWLLFALLLPNVCSLGWYLTKSAYTSRILGVWICTDSPLWDLNTPWATRALAVSHDYSYQHAIQLLLGACLACA